MVKDFLGHLKDWGVNPIIYVTGVTTLSLFGLSLIPSLSWVPKFILFFILTH